VEKSRGVEERVDGFVSGTNSAAIALNPVGNGSYRRVWPIRQRSVAAISPPVPDFAALQLPNRCVEDFECLLVAAVTTPASGHVERLAALPLIEPHGGRPKLIRLVADKGL
jgi:hypothetical protein